MKLFVWLEVKTLEGWLPGQALALARTKEEAIALAVAHIFPRAEERSHWHAAEARKLRAELTATEPDVYEEPVGFALHGSD